MKKTFLPWLMISIFALVIFYGCGGKKEPTKLTAEELISQGWTKFDAGNFSGASGDFSAAIALDSTANNYEGLLGLGWAELRRNNAGLASKAFIAYLDTIPDSNDAKGGLALAYNAEKKFQDAINYALPVLSSQTNWSFSRDNRFNYLDLAYILANSYCLLANYSQSLAVVQQYFDPNFKPDINTYEGRRELSDKIVSLYPG